MHKENPVDQKLRKNFPAVYVTMMSIIVALAAEELLARLDRIETLFEFSGACLVIWTQSSLVLLLAALFWWVTVRWVVSIPWRFGFSDAIGPLVLLVAFHFFAAAVGTSASRWFGAQGLIAVGGSINYFVNARRAVLHFGLPSAPSLTALLIPTAYGLVIGIVALFVATLGSGRTLSVAMYLGLNALVAAGMAAFAITELRVWRHLANLVQR
jgi:hypothetical protein